MRDTVGNIEVGGGGFVIFGGGFVKRGVRPPPPPEPPLVTGLYQVDSAVLDPLAEYNH